MTRTFPPLAAPGPSDFLWATGIEDTFITAPNRLTGRTLDEYALTEHYQRWEEDLRLIADLGVPAARYGIPWHRVCPRAGEYDWSWTDPVLDRMVNTHRIEPIVDLVHYGTPPWMDGSFFNPHYPQHVADYARAFSEHYKGLCAWYTPLNEPRVNAWYCGRIGWWPPYARSVRGFVRMILQLARGICRTQHAIAEVEPNSVFAHVDATDLYIPADPDDPMLREEAARRQEIVFLALDLVMGRVVDDHPLRGWLREQGASDDELRWFEHNAVQPSLMGINMYPMYSRKSVRRAPGGSVRVKIIPCWAETLTELTRLYAARYAPLPIMVSETACSGSVPRRVRWLQDSTSALGALRAEGLPIVGYTWWPLFSLVTWAYQRGKGPIEKYLLDMGLWNLRPGPNGLERVHTRVVDAYKRAVAHGAPSAGPSAQSGGSE